MSTLYDVRIEGPVMPQIDPIKDKQSAKLDQEMGWESRHGIIRRFGRSPAQVDAERNSDNAMPEPPQVAPPAAPSPNRADDTENENEDDSE